MTGAELTRGEYAAERARIVDELHILGGMLDDLDARYRHRGWPPHDPRPLAVRAGCCDERRRPCAYHEGYTDALDDLTARPRPRYGLDRVTLTDWRDV